MRSPIRLGKPALGIAESGSEAQLRQFAQNRQQRLRADGAVRADRLNIFVFSFSHTSCGTPAAECGAFFGIGQLRHDRQARK